jgi:hypothetical protein
MLFQAQHVLINGEVHAWYIQGQVLRLRVREEQIPNRRETSTGYTRHTTTNHTQGNAELLGYCGQHSSACTA